VLADMCELDITDMLDSQVAHIAHLSKRLHDAVEAAGPTDVVAVWRSESSRAALRFLERVRTARESPWRTLDGRD